MLIKRANFLAGLFFFLVFFFAARASAGTITDDFVSRIKCQLNLTDDQTVWIKSGIIVYVTSQGKSRSEVQLTQRIEQVLNDSQRASWKAVKNTFFHDINSRLAGGKKEDMIASDCFS